jgi:hypothetical protein
VPLDLLFNVWLGLGLALCARDRVRADGPFAFPAFAMVAGFAGVVIAPVALYLYAAHPAWTWMYLFDPSTGPGLLILPLVTLHAGAVLGGFYLGARLLRGGKPKVLPGILLGAPLVLLILVALAWGRLGRYGSYVEFHDGRALPIMDVKLGYVMVGVILAIVAGAGFTAVELLRDARRVRAR